MGTYFHRYRLEPLDGASVLHIVHMDEMQMRYGDATGANVGENKQYAIHYNGNSKWLTLGKCYRHVMTIGKDGSTMDSEDKDN